MDGSLWTFVSKPLILSDWWQRIGPFFQKGLLLPMPVPEKVVSTYPLHTWEYDEIPWMEVKTRVTHVLVRRKRSEYDDIWLSLIHI